MNSKESTPPDLTKEWEYDSDHRIAWWFLLASAFWCVLALLTLSLTLFALVEPEWLVPEYSFGRMRSLHWNLILFAMVANGVFAGVYFSLQRLCKTRIWSRSLAYLHFLGWQFVSVWIAATLLSGHRQQREFGELVWTIDVTILGLWFLFAVNLIQTIVRRRERHMYPSLWFYLASAIAVLPIYLLGNLAWPGQGYASEPMLSGLADGFSQSWSAEGLLMFMVVMPTMGLMYYFLPKATGFPLPNYRLIVIQFWAMTTLGILASSRWMHFMPIPEWVSSVSMLAGVAMFFPGWVGVLNGWGLVRRALSAKQFRKEPSLLFFAAGICIFGFWVIEYTLSSFKSGMAIAGFTHWRTANFYAATLGWAGFTIVGSGFVMSQAVLRKKLWNPQWVRVQFWVSVAGICVLLTAFYVTGVAQGMMGGQVDGMGTLVYPEFVEIVTMVSSLWWMGAIASVLSLVGACLFLVYLPIGWLLRNRKPRARTTLAAKLRGEFDPEEPAESTLAGAPVLELGIKVDQLKQFLWHREWERAPGRFVSVLMAVVGLGIAIEFLPVWLMPVPTQSAGLAYTPLELVGRHVYIREGCAGCHTQTSRPLVGEVTRYGDYSVAADYAFDQPVQWGSSRIGPDLSQEGGRQNSNWHWEHLQDPQEVSPGSVMPNFSYLTKTEIELPLVRELIAHEIARGIDYEEELLAPDELSEEDRLYGEITPLEKSLVGQAEVIAADMVQNGGPGGKLNQEATALIAYLQRLGAQ